MTNKTDSSFHQGTSLDSVLITQIYSRATLASIATMINAVILVFILRGLFSKSALMLWFAAFSIPALAPITIRFFLMGNEIHLAMGTMTMLFGILSFMTAKHVNRSTRELVLLKETFAHQLQYRTAELREANAQLTSEKDKLQKMISEIKILRGLLPICASCKRIRDDEGYWQKLEKYIQDRSDAQFSHSICPECIQKLYPDLEDD